ncbi:AraC family transcriptional regulator [Vibrio sp. TH_r3]|uniref:helix-turn-helix domain-containing protein n=1 Tax=Vibrio sp. TH_r3 TaxID=3082084 RepID=UPI00295588B6|nr:AraC family transcriptional regulator [Vibrio sp. TH_r3]MDV7105123.1 AraC family transcriptional regulator [Vibrio sp. TH_r3]
MLEKNKKLFESVVDEIKPSTEWKDHTYLAQGCKERFLTQSDLPELQDQQIFMAGLSELKDGYEVERLGADVHTLLFTLDGEGQLITRESIVSILPNSLTILPAGLPFRFGLPENKTPNEWKMIWMLMSKDSPWDYLAQFSQSVVPFHECELLWSMLVLLHNEIGGRATYRKLLISEISRLLTGVEAKTSTSIIRVQVLFNQIESQLHMLWSVKDMAAKCFISEEQLNRLTKSLYGCSPRARLISLRMEKAVDLLHHKDWSISMISQRLGYNDPYNFTHRFKAYHGCSPREYRKTYIHL